METDWIANRYIKKRKTLPEGADSSPRAVGTALMADMNSPNEKYLLNA
jgi:hypothetical protein